MVNSILRHSINNKDNNNQWPRMICLENVSVHISPHRSSLHRCGPALPHRLKRARLTAPATSPSMIKGQSNSIRKQEINRQFSGDQSIDQRSITHLIREKSFNYLRSTGKELLHWLLIDQIVSGTNQRQVEKVRDDSHHPMIL